MILRDRYRGALLGLAVGDAVGTTLEFQVPGTFEPLTDMVGGGPFHLRAGQWTDDTSMALCLADSLIACRGFDARDQMQRYLRWYSEGHRSATGKCFDIGRTVRLALDTFVMTDEPYSGPTEARTAGNGSLMRLVPVPLAYRADPARAIAMSAASSRTTHGAREAVDACRYFGGLILGALMGEPKDALLGPRYSPVPQLWAAEPLSTAVGEVADGSFKTRQPPAIRGSGYVVRTLEAALWAFHNSDDFPTGLLAAVNLGEDADTTGAIYGQLAGAYYGGAAIPAAWRERLHAGVEIAALADRLHQLSDGEPV